MITFSPPFAAECVLVYIETPNCNNLLKWLATSFQSAAFINYEQVNMNDRFGEVMLINLRARGCNLAGVESCLSLDTQISRFVFSDRPRSRDSNDLSIFRFVQCGWHGARSWDMCQIYDSLPVQERQRIERIEMLDEGELLVQLFQHYCITLAWMGELFQDIEIT